MARKISFPLVVAATIALSALTVAHASEEAAPAPAPPAGTQKKVRMKPLAPPVPGVPTANSGLPAFDPGQRLAALTTRLKLSPEQQAKLKPVLEDTEEQVKAAWSAGTKPTAAHDKVKGILEASDVRIRAILDGNQKEEWEKMKEEVKTASRTNFGATTLK